MNKPVVLRTIAFATCRKDCSTHLFSLHDGKKEECLGRGLGLGADRRRTDERMHNQKINELTTKKEKGKHIIMYTLFLLIER